MACGIHTRASKIIKQSGSRNPFCIASDLGVSVSFEDLGALKGMYTCIKRNRFIVVNNMLDEYMQMIICAHELGHDQLHRQLATNKWLQEFVIYDMDSKPEYEANLFASEILLPDERVIELIDRNYDIDQIARTMYTDINLIALKLKSLNQKGYTFKQFNHHSDFLKTDWK